MENRNGGNLHRSISPPFALMMPLDPTIKLPVQRSVPVTTMVTRPKGKIIAPIMRMSPGALVWNHGAVFVLNSAAQAKARKQPAMNELMKILSTRMLALATPAREQSSTVSFGLYRLTTTF
nr:hypothetical protein CFP56_23874 [Quercus suber]